MTERNIAPHVAEYERLQQGLDAGIAQIRRENHGLVEAVRRQIDLGAVQITEFVFHPEEGTLLDVRLIKKPIEEKPTNGLSYTVFEQ
jgi:hypothetical protein